MSFICLFISVPTTNVIMTLQLFVCCFTHSFKLWR